MPLLIFFISFFALVETVKKIYNNQPDF